MDGWRSEQSNEWSDNNDQRNCSWSMEGQRTADSKQTKWTSETLIRVDEAAPVRAAGLGKGKIGRPAQLPRACREQASHTDHRRTHCIPMPAACARPFSSCSNISRRAERRLGGEGTAGKNPLTPALN